MRPEGHRRLNANPILALYQFWDIHGVEAGPDAGRLFLGSQVFGKISDFLYHSGILSIFGKLERLLC